MRFALVTGIVVLARSFFVLALLPGVVVAGPYTLSSVTYADSTVVPLPGDYSLEVSDMSNYEYKLNMHVKNSLRATMTVTDKLVIPAPESEEEFMEELGQDSSITVTSVRISSVSSSRMLPPREVFEVEIGLRTILPETITMIQQLTESNRTMLTFEGNAGSVVWIEDP